MGSINDTPAYKGINWSRRLNKLNAKEYSLIGNVNIILEVIIKNTLKFNKLTSAEEIYEDMISVQNDKVLEIESNKKVDITSIENLCEALCMNNGVLIKLETNGKSYYKLNYKENI